MRRDRVIRPGKRKPRAAVKPSAAGAQFPLSDFIIPPSDTQGRSQSVSLGLPPSLTRLTSMLLEVGHLPFETSQDIYRWAVYHGLTKLVELSKDEMVIGEHAQLATWVRVASKMMESMRYKLALDKYIKDLDTLTEDGHHEKALQLAELMWMNTDKIDDPYWRKLYTVKARAALDRLKKLAGKRKERREGADRRNGGDPDAD